MNTYLIERKEGAYYDEVNGMVINAKTKKEALKIASSCDWGDWRYKEEGIKIKCVNSIKGVILVDLRAG